MRKCFSLSVSFFPLIKSLARTLNRIQLLGLFTTSIVILLQFLSPMRIYIVGDVIWYGLCETYFYLQPLNAYACSQFDEKFATVSMRSRFSRFSLSAFANFSYENKKYIKNIREASKCGNVSTTSSMQSSRFIKLSVPLICNIPYKYRQ